MTTDHLTYFGRCSNPDCGKLHAATIPVQIDETQLPHSCEACGSDIIWETMEHHHRLCQLKKARSVWWIILIAALISAATLTGILAYRQHLVHRSYSAEEFNAARQQADALSVADILNQLKQDGVSDRSLQSILQLTPSTLYRLRSRMTEPTESFERCVQVLYQDYLLFGKRWPVVRWKYRTSSQIDIYHGQLDPDKERKIE